MKISPVLFPAVTVTMVRGRKIQTALRSNQIAGFVTVLSWEKVILNNILMLVACSSQNPKYTLTLYFSQIISNKQQHVTAIYIKGP